MQHNNNLTSENDGRVELCVTLLLKHTPRHEIRIARGVLCRGRIRRRGGPG